MYCRPRVFFSLFTFHFSFIRVLPWLMISMQTSRRHGQRLSAAISWYTSSVADSIFSSV
jgi:hypothetical protein